MLDLQIRRILPQSRQEYDELNRLLQEVKIKLDRNLDYILGLYTCLLYTSDAADDIALV